MSTKNQQFSTVTTFSAECEICEADLELNSDLEVGELLECIECGTELEVASISPLELIEAPSEGEDWGE